MCEIIRFIFPDTRVFLNEAVTQKSINMQSMKTNEERGVMQQVAECLSFDESL